MQCLGTEKSLWSCPFKNITQEDCKHTEDAAVRCNIPYMGYETLVRAVGLSGVGCWEGPGDSLWSGPSCLLLCTPLHLAHFPLGNP